MNKSYMANIFERCSWNTLNDCKYYTLSYFSSSNSVKSVFIVFPNSVDPWLNLLLNFKPFRTFSEIIFVLQAFTPSTRNRRWSAHPDMLKQYAVCLSKKIKALKQLDIQQPRIYFDIWRSLNKRFQQRLVDPNVDMVAADWSPFRDSPWLRPLLTGLLFVILVIIIIILPFIANACAF